MSWKNPSTPIAMHVIPFAPGTLFTRIFYGSGVAMAIISLSDGCFVDANEACAALLGYERDDLIGRRVVDFSFLDAPTARRLAARLGEAGRLRETAALIYPRNREPRDAIISIQTEEWEGQQYAIAYFQDLTEHRQMQEAIVASEVRFRFFFDAMPLPTVVYHEETLQLLDANPAACAFYGYSHEEMLHLALSDLWPPDRVDAYQAENSSLLPGIGESFLRQHHTRNGDIVDVNVSHYAFVLDGRPARLAVIEDVTEQQAAQRALRESAEHLRIVADLVTDTIWDYDLITDQVTYTRGMRWQFGHDLNTHLAPDWWRDRLHPEDAPGVWESLLHVLEGQESVWTSQYRFRRADDSYAYVLDRGYVFRDSSGTPVRLVGAMVDITGQMEMRRAMAQATLAERQRLARDLHDAVTQSLYSLTLMAEAARRRASAGDSTGMLEYVERLGDVAQQSLREMHLLVYELRPTALEQAGLVGALRLRLATIERRLGVEVRLRAELRRELPGPTQVQLFRVAEEALNNALKHAEATLLDIVVFSDESNVVLEVRDNGRGFAVEKAAESAGLGLVSMRERIDSLGGVLELESCPGGGTLVRVKLNG